MHSFHIKHTGLSLQNYRMQEKLVLQEELTVISFHYNHSSTNISKNNFFRDIAKIEKAADSLLCCFG